jgi:ubiquinone/menaquinone biosynthesis C-methylase UbiE
MDNKQTPLSARHQVERHFHDHKAATHNHDVSRDFYSAGGLDLVWTSYIKAIGDFKGKRILDFGCGEGWSAIQYAKYGADVYSFDISPESVRNLTKEATERDLASRIHPAVMAAECLGYPANRFDLVLGVAILHHTDPFAAGAEISRVLKPGGRALFIEPLAHNWFLRLFRWLTPWRRTPTEQPMSIQQIGTFGSYFKKLDYRGYHLVSIFPQGLLWATGNRALFHLSLSATELIDRSLLRAFPSLNRYCWSAIIEVSK